MKNRKIISLALCIVALLASKLFMTNSYANEPEINQDEQHQINEPAIENESRITNTVGNDINNFVNVEDPFNITFNEGEEDVSEKVSQWINFKASSIIDVLQTIGIWLCFGVFIICGFKTVVGVFGKGDKIGKGVTGMIIAAICFVIIQYADVVFKCLLDFIIA